MPDYKPVENTVLGYDVSGDGTLGGNAYSLLANPAGYIYYNAGRGDVNGTDDVSSIDSYTVSNYRPSNWMQRQLNATGVAQEEQRYNNALDRIYNAAEAEKARQFNAQQAQLQRDFEERMSNTAYSRAAQDLKSIGVNPYVLLSGMSAASTPSGATASGSNASHSGNASYAKSGLGTSLVSSAFNLARSALGVYGNIVSKLI